MSAEKVANYSPEQVEMLIAEYTASPTSETVEMLAQKVGHSVRSVIAKLSREGVYQPKAKMAGKRVALKSELVAEIAKRVGESEETMESLEKATSKALLAILSKLPQVEA